MRRGCWSAPVSLQAGRCKSIFSDLLVLYLLGKKTAFEILIPRYPRGFHLVSAIIFAIVSITHPQSLNADTNGSPVLNQLLNPVGYSTAVFEMGGRLYRSGWSTNGFYLYSSTNRSDLLKLDSKKIVAGRSGDIVWRSHGGVVAMVNRATESREQVMKRVGDIWFDETMATIPIMMGITAIPINSIAAKEDGKLGAVRLNGVAVTVEEIQNHEGIERAVLVSYANALESRSKLAVVLREFENGALFVCKNYSGWDKAKTNAPTQPYALLNCNLSAKPLPETFFLPVNLFATNGVSSVTMLFSATNTLVVVDGKISKSKLIGKAPSEKAGGMWFFAIMVGASVAFAYGLSRFRKSQKNKGRSNE